MFTLELLDEVTGLALNPQRYAMTAENPTTYSLKLSVSVGSVLKYRYIQEGKQTAIEYNSIGKQVRYRLYNAISPGENPRCRSRLEQLALSRKLWPNSRPCNKL